MEGMVFWNPADESVVLVEYNAEQDIFFQGRYRTLPSGEVHRTYDAFFTGNQKVPSGCSVLHAGSSGK